jgi:hypothetical protein
MEATVKRKRRRRRRMWWQGMRWPAGRIFL